MAENQVKKGGISVETEHIFPIIKKWLYSEKEIFLREIVSNASDAITKLKRLASLGKYDGDEDAYRIDVSFNKTEKTLTVADNGIGMSAEEVEKYICNMALSGAMDFVREYEGENERNAGGIIGHFGLGFYSAFMVADTVDVITKSYLDAPAVCFTCTEDGSYTIEEGVERGRGTSVVMHINEDGEEFLSEGKLREVLNRYCAFMPVEIYLTDEEKEEDAEKKDGEEIKPTPVNDINPLWQKNASDCTEEEYTAFYQKAFSDYRESLFHLHLNADYPLNFKGILYFPKIQENFENLEGKIKLFYNQVFVADNIKEVIPEYLLMLRGVLDCPELPLNVSRSYLQNSAYVTKVSQYIVKKVADKLSSMFRNEREKYEGLWEDIRTFVEYGAICDKKFYDKVKDALLFVKTDGTKLSLSELAEVAGEKKTLYYTSNPAQQSQYIAMYEARNIPVFVMEKMLDDRFMQTVEQNGEGLKFVRVDAGTDALREGETGEEKNETLFTLFEVFSTEKQKLTVSAERLADASVPAILTVSEEARRMGDMMKLYAPDMEDMPVDATLILNMANPIISRLAEGGYGEKAEKVAKQVYSLALLSQRPLSSEEMKEFLCDSYNVLSEIG
ncbi:MAG: molecular chaperone HtpG [Clostridia bacterium]|nr:molecular chaperone HtpG [Clostridia bacterium]